MKHNFKELLVWKKSIELVKSIYLVSASLPLEEKFGLISQMNRSSISISSNIAEGSGRTTNKEFLYFLNVAISSSYELETQLIIANQLFLVEVEDLLSQISEVQKMILGLKKKFRK